jgi:hypothetical protein
VNCSEVQEQLSAYFDGELPPEREALIAEHIDGCAPCAEKLAGFEKLSAMSAELRHPPAPAELWDGLEAKLDADNKVEIAASQGRPKRMAMVATIAAVLLIGASIGLYIKRTWFSEEHVNHLARNFTEYLETLHQNPQQAQQVLMANYNGRAADFKTAAEVLKYEPVVAQGMPKGYSLEKVNLLELPCCVCSQAVIKREDGSELAVFEHDKHQHNWFGDRPMVNCKCAGRSCDLVQVNDTLAIRCSLGSRNMTIVGLRDLEEATRLIAHLEKAN